MVMPFIGPQDLIYGVLVALILSSLDCDVYISPFLGEMMIIFIVTSGLPVMECLLQEALEDLEPI
jgi:hypothetical protein